MRPPNCSHVPERLLPNPDISGVGVSLACSITAGLTLTLVITYYVLAYRPDVHPCYDSGHGSSQSHWRPNPIDNHILFWRKSSRAQQDPAGSHPRKSATTKSMLTKAVLQISDYQLITGFAILISGFTQLRSGISTYHWAKLTRLAWFCSITHLCCLTFLRDHCHHHKKSRIWRVPAMLIMVVMLIVALIPTGQYVWQDPENLMNRKNSKLWPSPFEYAICSFYRTTYYPKSGKDIKASHWEATRFRAAVTITLVGVGMVTRICRLHTAPSKLCLHVRRQLSQVCRRFLWKIYALGTANHIASYLARSFLYQPMLAVFLIARLILDLAVSMAFEVWWLVVSFAWGILAVWGKPVFSNTGKTEQTYVEEEDIGEWSFGQVIAIVILAAPLVAMIEGIATEHHDKNTHDPSTPNESSSPSNSMMSAPPSQARNIHLSNACPDQDFYTDYYSFASFIYASLVGLVALSTWLTMESLNRSRSPVILLRPNYGSTFPPAKIASSVYVNALLSIAFGKFPVASRAFRVSLSMCFFFVHCVVYCFSSGVFFVIAGILWSWSWKKIEPYCYVELYTLAASFSVYIVISLLATPGHVWYKLFVSRASNGQNDFSVTIV